MFACDQIGSDEILTVPDQTSQENLLQGRLYKETSGVSTINMLVFRLC